MSQETRSVASLGAFLEDEATPSDPVHPAEGVSYLTNQCCGGDPTPPLSSWTLRSRQPNLALSFPKSCSAFGSTPGTSRTGYGVRSRANRAGHSNTGNRFALHGLREPVCM